jgi:hypothetical protein
MDEETRSYFEALRGEMSAMRDALRGEIGGLREELRGEIGGLREELRGEIGGLREELRREIVDSAAETRRHAGVITEALRHDLQIVAEGVLTANQSIERLRPDVRRELDEHFGTVRLAFEDARRHTDVTTEALRQDIQSVAEGVFATNHALDQLRAEVHRGRDERG